MGNELGLIDGADPVLLCNDLDAQVRTQSPATATSVRHESGHAVHIHGSTAIASSGHQSISVKEAVRIARSNNLMGLVCTSTLLVRIFVFFSVPLSTVANHCDRTENGPCINPVC